MGAQVVVTSSAPKKLETFGHSIGGVLYTDDDWVAQAQALGTDGYDVIIDGAGGPNFGHLIRLLAPGGRIAFYGGTRGKWPAILPQHLFFKQVEILASTMGSPRDFDEMLIFMEQREIMPPVDEVFSLADGAAAFDHLESGKQFGKVILSISKDED